MKDLYVLPKYSSLKDELLNNPISSISLSCWNFCNQKAQYHQTSYPYLKTTADVEDYGFIAKNLSDHPSKFGYNDGDRMSINHLIVIMLYCALTVKWII